MAFDFIADFGGFHPVPAGNAELALDAAACVAACPNASAMLFVGAMISHLVKVLLCFSSPISPVDNSMRSYYISTKKQQHKTAL